MFDEEMSWYEVEGGQNQPVDHSGDLGSSDHAAQLASLRIILEQFDGQSRHASSCGSEAGQDTATNIPACCCDVSTSGK